MEKSGSSVSNGVEPNAIEDTLKQLLGARRIWQRGPALALADSAVLTLKIVGEFLSLHQDKEIFTYFRRWRQVVYILPLGASPVETEGPLRFLTDEHLNPETLYHLYRVRFPTALHMPCGGSLRCSIGPRGPALKI